MRKFLEFGRTDKDSKLENYRYGFIDAIKLVIIFSFLIYIINF